MYRSNIKILFRIYFNLLGKQGDYDNVNARTLSSIVSTTAVGIVYREYAGERNFLWKQRILIPYTTQHWQVRNLEPKPPENRPKDRSGLYLVFNFDFRVVARSNPRQDGLRFFVGYACDPNNPFNCLFSTCQPDGMCGCNANETTFLGMMCLPGKNWLLLTKLGLPTRTGHFFLARRLGESCIDNQQCRKMSRNSKCDVPRSLTVGVCKCVDGTSGLNATCSRGITLSSVLDPDPSKERKSKPARNFIGKSLDWLQSGMLPENACLLR